TASSSPSMDLVLLLARFLRRGAMTSSFPAAVVKIGDRMRVATMAAGRGCAARTRDPCIPVVLKFKAPSPRWFRREQRNRRAWPRALLPELRHRLHIFGLLRMLVWPPR